MRWGWLLGGILALAGAGAAVAWAVAKAKPAAPDATNQATGQQSTGTPPRPAGPAILLATGEWARTVTPATGKWAGVTFNLASGATPEQFLAALDKNGYIPTSLLV